MASPSPLLALPGMTDELARIESLLRGAVVSDDPHLTELAGHLIQAGGKRMRPALTVVAAASRTGLPVPEDVIRGGVAVELVQVGSLYHDDVMDEAATRRGVESVNARFGNLKVILSGDYLLAKSSEIAASISMEVAGLMATTIGRLCEGQVRELEGVFDVGRTEEAYTASIAGKTGSLFSAATRIGGLTGGLASEQVEALTVFGHNFGMAFQVVDDVLDVVATDEELGKPSGHDMAEGIYTLPVIRALQAGDEELRGLLGRPLTEQSEIERARKLVKAGRGVEEAVAEAQRYAVEAHDALTALPPGAPVDALTAAVDALAASVA